MRLAFFATILTVATTIWGQSIPAVPKTCVGLNKQAQELRAGNVTNSPETLMKLGSRGEACFNDVFAHLSPAQRAAAQTAFKLYEAATSRLIEGGRQRDVVEARAQADWDMKDGASQMASLFGQLSLLSYRYDQLLDQVKQYMSAEDNFHKAVAGATGVAVSPPKAIELPDKVESLECSDYHVGRYSSCWPPDYD